MDPETKEKDDDEGSTQAPVSPLRQETASKLYTQMPQIRHLIQQVPREGEAATDFLARLSDSPTPEDAITFIAFAVQPNMAIWWGYECLRTRHDDLSADDSALMRQIADWMSYPSRTNRFEIMKVALFAEPATPTVHLGLAVGWSGGRATPNDRARVPAWRCPHAVNTALLNCLARAGLAKRAESLSAFVKLGEELFGKSDTG